MVAEWHAALIMVVSFFFIQIAEAHCVAMTTTETTRRKAMTKIILLRIINFTPVYQQETDKTKNPHYTLGSLKSKPSLPEVRMFTEKSRHLIVWREERSGGSLSSPGDHI